MNSGLYCEICDQNWEAKESRSQERREQRQRKCGAPLTGPRPGPILATHRTQGGKAGAQRRKPRQETHIANRNNNTAPRPPAPRPPAHPAPTDWPIFLDEIAHVVVGNCSLVAVLLLFKTGCCKKEGGGCCLPRETNKQILLIMVYMLHKC